jgi:hypothetical protein
VVGDMMARGTATGKLQWSWNVQRVASPLTVKVQRVELYGSERESFFKAVSSSYEPSLDFERGNTVFTDGEYLYGYVVALDGEGRQIIDDATKRLVSYFTQVRIPPLCRSRCEGSAHVEYLPTYQIEDTHEPLYPNHAEYIPAWHR